MVRVSPFERELISAALSTPGPELAPGTILTLMPVTADFMRVSQEAISPALHDCGFRDAGSKTAFDSASWLSDAVRGILSAELIIADVTTLNADVMYTLGLCHGQGRCPLIVSQDFEELPFNLNQFRRIQYRDDEKGLFEFRGNLARAVRVFLAEADASRQAQ